MRYGSVCSGIEAATVAWHPLGWVPIFFSEIEAFPRAVLAHRWPGIPVHGDFTTISAGDYEPIDLLVGGTPCPPSCWGDPTPGERFDICPTCAGSGWIASDTPEPQIEYEDIFEGAAS